MSRSAGAGPRECLGEVRRERGLDVDPLGRERVLEGEAAGVEELALEREVSANAVDRVARDREADRREVHADLMRPPRLQAYDEQRVPRHELLDLEVRHGLARHVGVERDAGRLAAIPPDRRLDPARPRPWLA